MAHTHDMAKYIIIFHNTYRFGSGFLFGFRFDFPYSNVNVFYGILFYFIYCQCVCVCGLCRVYAGNDKDVEYKVPHSLVNGCRRIKQSFTDDVTYSHMNSSSWIDFGMRWTTKKK